MRKNIFRTIALSCLSVISGCHLDDLDKVKPATISPNLALNLGFSEYTILELLEGLDGEALQVDGNDQSIALVFKDSTLFDDNEELIAISSVSNQEEFAPAENVPSTPIGYEIAISETFTFSFPANNGEEIDSVFFNSGTLDFEMESTFEGDIDYTWVIEGTREVETNLDLTQTKELVYSSGSIFDNYSRPLDGLKSKFYKNAFDENEFAVKVTGTISFAAGVEILPTHQMTFDLAFNNPSFSKVYGYFGNDPIELQNQSIALGGLNDFSGEGLKLEDPKIYLITKSSYGLDLELEFNEVKAIGLNNSELSLEEKTPGIDGFVSSPDTEGEVKIDTVLLDNINSNIDDLLNSTPLSIDFAISGVPNPPSSTLSSNFLLEESQIQVISEIVVPLQFKMDEYTVDFDFDLEALDDINEARSMKFILITTNGIPFFGSIDLQFADSQGNILYSLLDAAEIESPEVGEDGKIIEPKLSTSGIALDPEGIDALLMAEKVLAVANLSTFESEEDRFVTIYSDYTIKIELALAGEVSIEL